MKTKVIFLIAAFLPGVLSAQITLDRCISAATEHYPQSKQLGLTDLSYGYKTTDAGKAYLPQVSAAAKASYQSDVTSLPISIPGMSIPTLDKDQYNITLQVDQLIWDGGLVKAQKESIKAENSAERKKTEADIFQVRDKVNQVYFGILLADENLRLSKLLKEELARSEEKVSALCKTGYASQSDVDAVKVEFLNALQREDDIRSGRRTLINMLTILTGMEIGEETVFEVPSVIGTDEIVEAKRPETEAIDAMKTLADTKKDLIDAKNMFKIGAFVQGGYGKPGLNMLSNKFDPYYLGGIRFSWNFGGLYTKKSEKEQVEIQKRGLDVQRETFLYNLSLKTSQQRENIARLKAITLNDNKIIELRKNIKKASESRLEGGTISVNDYLGDINKLDMALRTKSAHEIEYLNALYDYKSTMNN